MITNFLYLCIFNENLEIIWDKVFKNGPSKICERQPLKDLKEYDLPKADHNPSNFLKTVFRNFNWSILEYFVPYGIKINHHLLSKAFFSWLFH